MSRKKQNIIFFVVIAVLSVCMLFFLFLEKKKQKGDQVLIYVEGVLIQEIPLEKEGEILIHGNPGDNVLEIRNGEVYMKEASCKNQICVKQGTVSKDGETIICLPNQIVVEISSGSHEMDAVVR